MRRNNSSKEEAIKHYIELNATVGSEPIVFQGVEYVDLRECCRMLDISYRWVCEKILNQELSVEEVLLYYKGKKEALRKMEKEPIRLENGVLYNNLAEFCTALKIRKKDIYGYIYANDCSVSEAATYYADRQMVSEKEIPQIGDHIYKDLRECCKDQKVPYRWVCNKMLQEDVSVQDAVQYYKRKQEKRQQKAQRQVPVKGKMPEPQHVNVLGKKYESKERCYKGLGITKKSVQNHMKKTSCTFEEAVVYCYEKKLEKQFEFRGEIYKSYNACCTAYNLAQEYVAIKAKREKITRQEAMEKLLAQRESEKTI